MSGGGTSELVEPPLGDLVSVRGGGYQVVKMGVKMFGQVRALGENASFSVKQGRVGGGENDMDKLCGGCCAKKILFPC